MARSSYLTESDEKILNEVVDSKETDITLQRVSRALEQSLGKTNLPSHCDSFEGLAVELMLRLNGLVVLVRKETYDAHLQEFDALMLALNETVSKP